MNHLPNDAIAMNEERKELDLSGAKTLSKEDWEKPEVVAEAVRLKDEFGLDPTDDAFTSRLATFVEKWVGQASVPTHLLALFVGDLRRDLPGKPHKESAGK